MPNCCKILLDAIEWKCSPEKRSSLTTMNPKARKPKEVVLIAGGDFRSCRIIETFGTYLDKRSTVWSTHIIFDNFSSAMCNEDLYIVGGRYQNEITDKVCILNLITKDLEELPSMYQKRSDLSIAIVQSQLFAIGGYNDLDFSMNTVERFCLIKKKWRTVASKSLAKFLKVHVQIQWKYILLKGTNGPTLHLHMTQNRYNFAATTLGDYIYVFGGIDNFGLEISSAEKFNIKTREWTSIADMPEPRWGYASVAFQEKIICLGGSKILEYNPQSDTWREIGILEHARRCHSAFVVPFKLFEDGKSPVQ
ncbi:kelch-like protein 25 [Arctopsyche grandis]|uniref:kelch-like protein 25 n=1 Tax=Arctopsyche grandis TaxID=121162 RepID=UPI00406D6A66